MTRRDLLRATVGALVAPVVGLLPKRKPQFTGATIRFYEDGKLVELWDSPVHQQQPLVTCTWLRAKGVI
jgi:hypothetical protein